MPTRFQCAILVVSEHPFKGSGLVFSHFSSVIKDIFFSLLLVGELCAVRLEVDDDLGPVGDALRLPDGVGAEPVRLPVVRHGLARARALREHLDLVGHHEGRVEAHAELANDVLGVQGAALEARIRKRIILARMKWTHFG